MESKRVFIGEQAKGRAAKSHIIRGCQIAATARAFAFFVGFRAKFGRLGHSVLQNGFGGGKRSRKSKCHPVYSKIKPAARR
jgi:hypothetical protein